MKAAAGSRWRLRYHVTVTGPGAASGGIQKRDVAATLTGFFELGDIDAAAVSRPAKAARAGQTTATDAERRFVQAARIKVVKFEADPAFGKLAGISRDGLSAGFSHPWLTFLDRRGTVLDGRFAGLTPGPARELMWAVSTATQLSRPAHDGAKTWQLRERDANGDVQATYWRQPGKIRRTRATVQAQRRGYDARGETTYALADDGTVAAVHHRADSVVAMAVVGGSGYRVTWHVEVDLERVGPSTSLAWSRGLGATTTRRRGQDAGEPIDSRNGWRRRVAGRSLSTLMTSLRQAAAASDWRSRQTLRTDLAALISLDDGAATQVTKLIHGGGLAEPVERSLLEALGTAATPAAQGALAGLISAEGGSAHTRLQATQVTAFMTPASPVVVDAVRRASTARAVAVRGAALGAMGVMARLSAGYDAETSRALVDELVERAAVALGVSKAALTGDVATVMTVATVAAGSAAAGANADKMLNNQHFSAALALNKQRIVSAVALVVAAPGADKTAAAKIGTNDTGANGPNADETKSKAQTKDSATSEAALNQPPPVGWRARCAWLGALGNTGDIKILPVVMGSLKDDEEWVRGAAVYALRWVKHPMALNLITKALFSDKSRWVRKEATRAAWFRGADDLSTLGLLERTLLQDPDPRVRQEAAYHLAIWTTDSPAIREVLQKALKTERSPQVVDALKGYLAATPMSQLKPPSKVVAQAGDQQQRQLATPGAGTPPAADKEAP